MLGGNYWLENPRIISASGFTEYKQKCYLFTFSLTLSAYVCTRRIKVLLLLLICIHILPKDKIILTTNMVHLLPISDDDCEEGATWAQFGQNEDQSKYFGVEASVFHSQLV